jgi:hypothetical protein
MPITAFDQVANNVQSTLAEDLDASETGIDVASGASFPTPGNGYWATIWDADTYADPALDPDMEVVRVTGKSSNTLTVTRGQRGTSGVAHLTGNAIRALIDSDLISDIHDAVNAIERWAGPFGNRQWTDCIEKPEQSHWQPRVSGGSVAISTNAAATAGRPGVWDIATGGGTTDWASITLGDFAVGAHILLGGGTWALEAVLYLPNLSDAGQEYDCRFGFGDLQGGDHANGVYFEYDRSLRTNWSICAANASTYTRTDSAVAVAAATWVKLRIEINAAGTSAEFFINGTSVGTVSTNIPTANRVYPILHFVKSAGGTTRRVFVDCLDVHHVLTTAR